MSIRTLEIAVEGTAALLLSNAGYSDPLGDYQEKKEFFTGKKGKSKTKEVHRAIRSIDWLLSGYWETEGILEVDEAENTVNFEGFSDPYLPGSNLQRCLRNAATKWKLGKDVMRSVTVINNPSLQYDGPRDCRDLFNSRTPKFQLSAFTGRGVFVNRLTFPEWRAKFLLNLDDELMQIDQLRRIANMAGKSEGLGTWRPRYGRFKVASINEVELGADD